MNHIRTQGPLVPSETLVSVLRFDIASQWLRSRMRKLDF
ncbi:MAG: hypothetical protein RL518_2111 [Pseudomonadota bacterium]|jgi:hypothetical protein